MGIRLSRAAPEPAISFNISGNVSIPRFFTHSTMSKSFEVKLNGNADEIIAKARGAALNNGIHFDGDEQTGHFAGHGIEGSYLILEDIMSVRIDKKPMIMPWSMIESTLRKYFA